MNPTPPDQPQARACALPITCDDCGNVLDAEGTQIAIVKLHCLDRVGPLIVRAVNQSELLEELLKKVPALLESHELFMGECGCRPDCDCDSCVSHREVEALLARAKQL